MMENDLFSDNNQQEEIRACSEDDTSSTTPSEAPSENGVLILPEAIQVHREELSYPDTVPSDLDSMMLLREERHTAHPHWQLQQQPLLQQQQAHSSSRASTTSSLHNSALFYSRHDEVQQSLFRHTTTTSPISSKNKWMMVAAAALFVFVMIVFCTVTTVLLVQERQHRRLESQLLREEILRLQEFTRAAVEAVPPKSDPPPKLQKTPPLSQLQDIPTPSKLKDTPPPKVNYTPPPKVQYTKIPWEEGSCRDAKKTIIDNCWVHAKADFELGECAVKTKRSLTRKAKKIGRSLLKTKQKLWKHAEDWLERNFNSMDPMEENQGPTSDHIKTILKGVAFATLATAVADTAMGWFSGDDSS